MYGYVRYAKEKFALITWIGRNVSPEKKAKVTTDKELVKEIFKVGIRRLEWVKLNPMLFITIMLLLYIVAYFYSERYFKCIVIFYYI